MPLQIIIWYLDFLARIVHNKYLQNPVVFSSFCLFFTCHPEKFCPSTYQTSQRVTSNQSTFASRLIISNPDLEEDTWEVSLMCLDSMLTTHHKWFRKLCSKSLQGVGKIYTVFSARSCRGICGAAAKADICLHSENHTGKKGYLLAMTTSLFLASAGNSLSPYLSIWGCSIQFASNKSKASCSFHFMTKQQLKKLLQCTE